MLIWKDESCSQYVIDTDNNGEIPNKQHVSGFDIHLQLMVFHTKFLVFHSHLQSLNIYSLCILEKQIVLELQEEGKIVTSDDPPVPFSCLNADFVKQVCSKYNRVIFIS